MLHRGIAILSMLAIALGFAGGVAPAAQAATPGITIDMLHQGRVIAEGALIPEGDGIQLRVQYDAEQSIAGQQIHITLPPSVTVSGALPGNEAIDSILANDDGTVTVTFKDPLPSGVTEGAFAINLTAVQVDGNTESPIIWKIGDDTGGVTIVVEDEVPPIVEVQNSYAKSVNPSNLDRFVQNSGSPDFRFTGLNPEIANQILTYTLVLGSAEARSGYSIMDALPAGLTFVPGSFTATMTTAEGESPYAFVPEQNGTTFAATVDVPAQSTLRITYQVQVTDIAALTALIQEQYDARNEQPGNYEITLRNQAVFGGTEERAVDVRLRGNIPGVGIGENFGKTGNWTLRDVIAAADGTLQPAAAMTYTLRANLTPWTGINPNFTLGRNVVISDTLIEQASWQTGEDFISVTGSGPITSLTEAAEFTGTAADFAANAYVGQYSVVGNRLLVNVGQDNTTNISITAKAQLDTTQGINMSGSTTVVDGKHYPWNNRAQFFYRDDDPVTRDHNAGVVVLPEGYEEGVNDSSAFAKTAVNQEVRVNPGQSAEVPYRFTIDTSKEQINPLKSKIVDAVNTDIFDISDLESIPVTGTYDGQVLAAEHFSRSLDTAGNLVIELSEAGRAFVAGLPEDRQWVVDVILTTVPFDGKETFEITNSATLVGADSEWDYVSEEQSEATSFGDEAEMRKRIYDRVTGSWVSNLDALIEGGKFVQPRFVYSIELIPRGNYGKDFPVTIFTREDVLPAGVEFLGFVEADGEGVPADSELEEHEIELSGNVIASYSEGVVTIRQKDGTSLDPSQGRIVTYFAVEGNDASQTVINTIAGSETSITPVGDPSIDIEKWSDEGSAPEYDAAGVVVNDGFNGDFDDAPGKLLVAGAPLPIRFTVSNDGREALKDIEVGDDVTAGRGEVADLSCTFPDESTGTVWAGPFEIGTQFECTGTLPALTNGDTHADLSKVSGIGVHSGVAVDDEDPWHARVPTPSIEVTKWNDEGEKPRYDESGTLLNDGFRGDFDIAPGKQLQAGEDQRIIFTLSNDGDEDLIGISVSDALTDGTGEITDLSCTFPDASTGLGWGGVFEMGTQFECTGTLPALFAGDTHSDRAMVTATGVHSGTGVTAKDDWNGYVDPEVPAAINPTTDTAGGALAQTGSSPGFWLGIGTLVLFIAGATVMLKRRGEHAGVLQGKIE